MPPNPPVTIHSDGACLGNPGPGGYGTVLQSGAHRRELSAGFRRTTNNRMELLGAIKGLEALQHACTVTLFSDSTYVVKAMRERWPHGWRERGWLTAAKKPVANQDLWQRLLALAAVHTIEWRWVRGHSGNRDNERCDELANAAARGKQLAVDAGYDQQPAG
ncbi:MAG TPA: ribonuclease HI [Planctomycetota bacterium]|nr:ribonuclease HI [Planctomycetota bacterium]